MTDDQLGLLAVVSITLGGMIGGGIYAVLGVVAGIAGPATWGAFVLAGLVALCAGYSFTRLNAITSGDGGVVTFVRGITGNSTLAGMTGWTLLLGYIGSMAMYAFAFGEFTVSLAAVPDTLRGVPGRPLISILAVAAFVGLNLVGARASGSVEAILVAGKVLILVAFGVGGILYGLSSAATPVRVGLGQVAGTGPVIAAGVSFVAFQGWELLFYDQERIENPVETIRTGIYLSVGAAVGIYVLVAIATVSLAPDALVSNPHTALKDAAAQILTPIGYGPLGGTIIALSALLSTGSAINATLFSTGYFAKNLLGSDLLPDRLGDADASGVPTRTLLGIGGLTAVATAVGSLEVITTFASIAFIVLFGGTSLLALRRRDHDAIHPIPPAIGVVGSGAFLPLMVWHLYRTDPRTFWLVTGLAVVVLGIELLYFERDVVEAELEQLESELSPDG